MALACPAEAAEKYAFDVQAGPLNVALVTLATQARVSIDTSDPGLRRARVRGLKGRYTLREALRRLLTGTAYDFSISSGQVVRIVARRTVRSPPPQSVARPPQAIAPPPPPPPEPIIVTATKQNAQLADYPGSIHVASLDEAQSFRFGSGGSEVLLRELPNLSSTDLGSGRNKIFIRGIADSSFNGQTQSTISQYLGESRLIYSAPDPDLALYDIERVEVVEGPQGTLYGAGSLGGVIRVLPRSPKMGVSEIAGTAAVTITGSDVGGDAAVVGNVPLGSDIAARVVGYAIRRPGYVDDLERNKNDINRTNITGLRAALRWEPRKHLSFDLGLVGQNTGARDGQYTDSGTSALTRRSFIAQPFDNDYRLAYLTARASLGSVQLVSNTSYTDHSIDTTFDATSPVLREQLVFNEDAHVSLLTHETRLSGSTGPFKSWVAGISVAYNLNRVDRAFGPTDSPDQIASVRSETLDGAVFAEATAPIWRTFSITLGGRLSYIRQTDQLEFPNEVTSNEPDRTNLRLLPTAALSWKPARGVLAYARYQEGFRPGAQQITGTSAQTAVQRFESDEIRTTEAGLRFGSEPGARFRGGVTYSYSRWNGVQADLITAEGFPYVANLGSGFVRYVSADLGWQPLEGLLLEASAFTTTSQLDKPSAGIMIGDQEDIPNISDEGWRVTGRYQASVGQSELSLQASLGYTGESFLAIGEPFGFSQGKFLDTSMGARADFGTWGISLDIENLRDSRANRFSYGNPFRLLEGNQRTPLRPRTVRIGIDARF